MASLGQDLKKERELRGISLNEIADTTKINLRFLRALEEDQVETLPSKFFIKGIIRAYAEYLGLEPDPFLNQYYELENLMGQEEKEEDQRAEGEEPVVPNKIKKVFFTVILVIVALAILLGVYFIIQKRKTPSTQSQEVIPPVIQQEPTIYPPLEAEPEEKSIAKPTHIDLKITFIQETWVQVFVDGGMALDGLKYPGEIFEVRALEELVIFSGNAGGFTYTLNETRGKPIGRRGEVIRDIKINLQNFENFLEETES
jgi:cytoskeletal protein RodZ